MIDKVRKLLGIPRKTGNKLIVSVEKLERRVALLENGRLEEYSVERNTSRNMLSSISGMPSQPRSTAESKKSTARVSAGSANGSRQRIFRIFIRLVPMLSCR